MNRKSFRLELKEIGNAGEFTGYDVIQESWDNGKRFLKELKLWEYSLVTFPANPLALVNNVKSLDRVSEMMQTGLNGSASTSARETSPSGMPSSGDTHPESVSNTLSTA